MSDHGIENPHKIGYIDLAQWIGPGHRECEAPRHAGLGFPAIAVIALAPLTAFGSLNTVDGQVWGACIECFGLMDQDIPGDWRLPGSYS